MYFLLYSMKSKCQSEEKLTSDEKNTEWKKPEGFGLQKEDKTKNKNKKKYST